MKPDAIGRELAEDIVAKRVPPGSLLPTEAQLSERFGAGRGAVREAIRSLAAAGLVETRHGVGSLVNDGARWNVFDPVVLRAHVTTGNLPALTNELIELRRVVEVEAAGLAAERIDAAGVRALRTWHDRVAHVLDLPESMAEADIAFHGVILEVAANRFLHAAIEYVRPVLSDARRMTAELGGPEGRRTAHAAHALILRSIEAGDAERARAEMRDHIRASEGDIRAAMLQLGPRAATVESGVHAHH